jgi:hypothetical protein
MLSETEFVDLPGTVATNQTWEPGDAFVIGTGTEFKKLETGPKEGTWGGAKIPLVSIDGTEALVCRVDSDAKLTLCKNFEGTKTGGVKMQLKQPSVGGLNVADGVSPVSRPLWKNPIVIIAVAGGVLTLAYFLLRKK